MLNDGIKGGLVVNDIHRRVKQRKINVKMP